MRWMRPRRRPPSVPPATVVPRGWWQARPAAVAVALAGFTATGLLTWGAFDADSRSSDALLRLETRQTASTLSAALPGIRSRISAALTVALDTRSPETFTKFVTNSADKSGIVSESLWQRTGSSTRLLAVAGSTPQLVADGRATAFFAAMQPSNDLHVTGILPGSPPRLGYALYPSASSEFIVYAESDLPSDKRLTIPPTSPYAQLDFALYLGPRADESQLLESSVRTPVKGHHATVSVPFGDTAVTLVASPRVPLTSTTSRALPWIALGGGLVFSLASAATTDYLSRRRQVADQLSARLSSLYSEQRSIAGTLQNSLLPKDLPTVAGVEIAARYWPGVRDVDIGGDWYDVVVLDQDRFVFVVGDVSGSGIPAASIMASLRFAARGFALEGHSPAAILERLKKTLDLDVDGHFATVVCGLIDVRRAQLTLANAGHPPPILRSGGGSCVLVEVPPIPPIGVTTAERADEATFPLPGDALLLVYTDGLIERRGEDLDVSIERLRRAALTHAESLDTFLEGIVNDLTEGKPDDDVALLGILRTT